MNIDLHGLIVLLLFLAPGFLYSRAYLRAKPRYQRTPDLFQQTVLAVAGSALIHAGLIAIVAFLVFIITILTGHNPLFEELLYTSIAEIPLRSVTGYLLFGAFYIASSLFLAGGCGTLLGSLTPERIPRWLQILFGIEPSEQVLLWYSTFVEEPLRAGIVRSHMVVWLRSGERFEGNLFELRVSTDETNAVELAIEEVTFQPSAKLTSDGAPISTPLPHHCVLLKSSDILWLARVDNPEKGKIV